MNGIGEIARQAMSGAEILREPKAETPPAPVAPPGPPPPPPAEVEVKPPASIADWYRQEMDTLIPRFDAASKAAQESIAQRSQDLRGVRERVATAPGLPESPALPDTPQAPKITARPFLASVPGEDAVTSLNKLMSGLGLIAQMAVGIRGGFPEGALAAYTGALNGWQAGDQRRAANEYQTFLGELKTYDRDVAAIRTKYDDAVRKWGGDQDRLKTELGILAAEHGLGREAIELSFRDPQRAYEQLNTTAKLLGDMQSSAANLAMKNAQWYADRELKLLDFAQKEKFHREKLAADAAKDRGPKLSDENSLRQQFLTQAKDFVTVRDSYSRLQEAAKSPSAAGDLALIFNYMKMLDPGSVVREAEFANAAAAGGYGERFQAAAQKIINGQRLSPEMRQDFISQASGQFAAQRSGQLQLENQFRGIAERAGIDPSQVVPDFVGTLRQGGAPPQHPATPGAHWEGDALVSDGGKYFSRDGGRTWQPR
jgi:hypothetical protein